MASGAKDTLTSNHVQSLQAALNQIKAEVTKAKAEKPSGATVEVLGVGQHKGSSSYHLRRAGQRRQTVAL